MLFPLYDLNPHRRFPLLTLLIIAINIAVMGWESSLGEERLSMMALQHGFVPARLTNMGKGPIAANVVVRDQFRGRPARIVKRLSTDPADVYTTFITTMFLHGGWGHLLMNMWMLWIFGNNIEDRLGSVVFVMFYLLGGVVATLAFWASDPQGLMPVIGASGAVAAVLGGYAITYPTAKVRTFIFLFIIAIVDLPALVLLGIWFLLQVVSGMLGFWGVVLEPVAFWAHIGGFVCGMILMPLLSLGAAPPGTDWRKETDEMFRFEDPRFREQ